MEKLIVNSEKERFELIVDDYTAFITYDIVDGVYHLPHTIVPKEIGGRGIASLLAKLTFEYLRENNLKAKVICSFLVKYYQKHPEISDVIFN